MKKIKLLLTILVIIMMTIYSLPVIAETDEVAYKGATLPLITDEHGKLAYQLHTNSSKLLSCNWDIRDTASTTSYYVFGAIQKVLEGDTDPTKIWINTVYGNTVTVNVGDGTTTEDKFTIGWNTGFIYNGKDYVVATDVDNYRTAISIADKIPENIGLAVKTEFKFRSEGQLLEVIYHVKNISNTAKDFLLWSGGDTELGGDDGCAVGVLEEGDVTNGFYLYSVHPDVFPNVENVQMPIFATDSDVKFWRTDRWTDVRRIYEYESPEAQASPDYVPKYANSMTEMFAGTPYIANMAEGHNPEDTAALWYWDDEHLSAGEEKVYSVLIGITNFTENVEENIASIVAAANNEIERETHTVTFSLDHIKGGGTIPDQEVDSRGKVQRPADPIHDGNMIFDDWYTDSTYTTKFDFENTIITDETTIVGRWKLPPGTIKIIDPTTPTDTKAEILTPVDKITSKVELTEEEQALKEAGKDISIYVEVNDVSDDMDEEDKEALEEKLGDTAEIGTYLDIGLYKQVDGEDPTRIPNSIEPIKLSLEIPEDLKNTDPNVERTYKLVKIENGELIEIELELKDGQLVFETDDFSVYALVYVDKPIDNPNTLDNILMYLVIFMISIFGIRFVNKNIKRLRKSN